MREEFCVLLNRLLIPKLYGVSMMGTCFAIYECTKETKQLTPGIEYDPDYMTDIAPADHWTYELLEPAGEAKMKELVASIKAMCADIVVQRSPHQQTGKAVLFCM